MTRAVTSARSGERGFTLIETMVAVSILAVGLLGLAGVLAAGLTRLTTAPSELIARQKAAEAIESVYAARDTRKLTWDQVRNAQGGSGSDGGIFLDGPQQMKSPGADGLVNTTDDEDVESLVEPGPDNLLGTDDDIRTPLSQYTREIEIRDISSTLRQLRVTVRVAGTQGERVFVLTTLISSYA